MSGSDRDVRLELSHREPDVPLRVLHVSMPTVAGVPTVLLGYVEDQLARGWTVTVACPDDADSGWLAGAARRAGAAVLPWAATRGPGPGTLRETRRLARLIRSARPDVVHLHSAKAGLAGRLAVRGRVATVFQPHAWSFLAVRGPVRAASVGWERLAARWTDALVCVSESERLAGSTHGVHARARVVANGVDCVRLQPADAAARAAARAELHLDGSPLAVCIGRLCEQKGQADLLDAWPAVSASVPGARLALVGDGPDRSALAERTPDSASAHADVLLAGESTAVHTWLAAADVVVVPSRWEGMALVPLEAMARGRSVVATDVDGMAEALPADAGAIVPVGDRAALAAAVTTRLRDVTAADREGLAGRRHAEKEHDRSAAAAEIVSVYSSVLRRRQRARRRGRSQLPAPGAGGAASSSTSGS